MEQIKDDPLALASHLATTHGVSLPPGSVERLARYAELLLQWNEKHNLISRSDTANIWQRHILHSLLPVLLFRIPSGLRFVDIGSGGGLPGLPIAIVRPDLTGVLVDSIRKKVEALKSMAAEIGISNVSVMNERVEGAEFIKRYQSSFDLVFARGVSQLPQLVQWSLRLLRKGSAEVSEDHGAKLLITPPAIVSFKGGDIRAEIERTQQLFPHVSVKEYAADVDGITDDSFVDKKLVLVRLHR